jgi:hypothetical protein
MPSKPKFRVGRRYWCTICGHPVKLIEYSPSEKKYKATCCPTKFNLDAETELRPLTARERGKNASR